MVLRQTMFLSSITRLNYNTYAPPLATSNTIYLIWISHSHLIVYKNNHKVFSKILLYALFFLLVLVHLRFKNCYLHISSSDVESTLFLPIQGTVYLSDLLLGDSKSHSKPKSASFFTWNSFIGKCKKCYFIFWAWRIWSWNGVYFVLQWFMRQVFIITLTLYRRGADCFI